MKVAVNRKRKLFTVIICIIALCAAAFFLYVSDGYEASEAAAAAFLQNDSMEVSSSFGSAYLPDEPTAGLIFYPGGKVDSFAYAPLMRACAEKGILCVLVDMPFDLAVFDISAADGIRERYPQAGSWYIGGHSLGGSMAASYLAENTEAFEGLILLGSYSVSDFSHTDLKVLSVYGSEDKVLNMEKYAENKSHLPADAAEHIIEGGCHAGFGMYGPQEGDGEPAISAEEQIQITADLIESFILG